MDERKIKILCSIIQDFICTGEPVGSRTLSKKYDLGISSSTIRNEMSDLEELGFLEQVHTSSGRKPSNKGYRLYVDKLMTPTRISKEEEFYIKSNFMNLDIYDMENVLRTKLDLISKLTNLACVLKKQSVKQNSIKSIQLVKISESDLLMVVVTNEGTIKSNVIRIDRKISKADLEVLNRILNKNLVSRTIEEVTLDVINEIFNSFNLNSNIFEQIMKVLHEVFTSYDKETEFYVEGIDNVFNYPEFKDASELKNFICFLNNTEKFDLLLKSNKQKDIEIRIGEENFIEGSHNYSVLLGNYGKNGKVLGTIGVIGPTRMNYPKIVSILRFLMKFINLSID